MRIDLYKLLRRHRDPLITELFEGDLSAQRTLRFHSDDDMARFRRGACLIRKIVFEEEMLLLQLSNVTL
jgi:hypothetical protein